MKTLNRKFQRRALLEYAHNQKQPFHWAGIRHKTVPHWIACRFSSQGPHGVKLSGWQTRDLLHQLHLTYAFTFITSAFIPFQTEDVKD